MAVVSNILPITVTTLFLLLFSTPANADGPANTAITRLKTPDVIEYGT